jgi:hypothetical protein
MIMSMNYRNAKHCRDNIRINCEIEHPIYGWIPFTCNPADTGAQFDVQELHQRMIDDNEVATMSQIEIDTEIGDEVRMIREGLLVSEVDPLVTNPLRWAEIATEQQEAWAAYRRALLDVPQQPGFPHQVVWPEHP